MLQIIRTKLHSMRLSKYPEGHPKKFTREHVGLCGAAYPPFGGLAVLKELRAEICSHLPLTAVLCWGRKYAHLKRKRYVSGLDPTSGNSRRLPVAARGVT